MATHDKEPIVDRFETVASPAAANEAVSKSKQEEDDGIVIATPSESWVLLDSKSDEEEVTLDYEASTAPRRRDAVGDLRSLRRLRQAIHAARGADVGVLGHVFVSSFE